MLSVGAETYEPFTCGCVAAVPITEPCNARRDGSPHCSLLDETRGVWFELRVSPELYGFAEELEETFLLRRFKLCNYPLYFKNAEVLEDFKAAVRRILALSPNGTGVLFPHCFVGGDCRNICGAVSFAELFALLDDCKVLGNVCYIVKKSEDLTEYYLRAGERGRFTEKELADAINKISAALPNYEIDRNENWICFGNGERCAMLHASLKLLFTSADISLDGVEVVRCGDFGAEEWSIDLKTLRERELIFWRDDNDEVVNTLCFSIQDLYFETV